MCIVNTSLFTGICTGSLSLNCTHLLIICTCYCYLSLSLNMSVFQIKKTMIQITQACKHLHKNLDVLIYIHLQTAHNK